MKKNEIKWEKYADPFEQDDPSFNDNIKPGMIMLANGSVPITEKTRLGTQYNLWVGHTNFKLTKLAIQAINNVDGVETLTPISQYRIQVGIGKNFEARNVRYKIEKLFRPEEMTLVDILVKNITAKYWTLIQNDDQMIEIVKANSQAELEEKCKNKKIIRTQDE